MKKFDNFISHLNVLSKAHLENLDNEFIVSGIIDKFSIQFELGWKVLKVLLRYEGHGIANSGSPREIIKAAYTIYDFIQEDTWLSMLRARNDMSHIYDGDASKRMVNTILTEYLPAFHAMKEGILERYHTVLETL